MEGLATPSPAADASAGAAVATASQPAPSSTRPHEMFAFSSIFEDSDIPDGPADDGVSNESDSTPAAPAAAAAQDDKPAPEESEGVKASEAPEPGSEPADPNRPPSRREQERLDHQQTIAERDAEIARLTSPEYREAIRAELLAETATHQSAEQIRADAERFDAACRMSDNDPRLAEIVPGTDLNLYQWREARKDLTSNYPEAERAIRADVERVANERIAAADTRAKQAIDQGWDRIKSDLGQQIAATAKLAGVDPEAFKGPGVHWQQMAEQIHAAGVATGSASKEAEIADRLTKAEERAARAEKLLEERDTEGLRNRRAPAVVGRSAGAATPGGGFDPGLGYRGNLAGAFDFANGTG